MNNRVIHIRSSDCIQPLGDSNNIIFNLNEAINCSEEEEIEICVLQVSIPFSFYNINFSNKFLDVLESNIDGSNQHTFSISIPEGNYNVSQFLQSLRLLLNQNSPSSIIYDLAYDKFTNKITFSILSPNKKATLLFSSGLNSLYDMQHILGFYKKQDYSFSFGNPIISDSTINMSPYENIYIHSNLGVVNAYDSSSKNLSPILLKIPINSQPFSYIQWENLAKIKYYSYLSTIQSINLSLKDLDGMPIDLNNNQWFISLRFDIHKKDEHKIFKLKRDSLIDVEIIDNDE